VLLSHYTSRAGLEGIAKTASFWATNFLAVNDKAEYVYAWGEIQREAFKYALKRIPPGLLQPGTDSDEATETSLQQMRHQLAASNGYGHLYVTSFALANTPEHEKSGILTLWDRYTKLEGYCLQYERADLERMVQLDAMKQNYAWAELAPVRYGVEKDTWSFRELVLQVGEAQLLHVLQETRDRRIPVRIQDHWAPSHLARKLMHFCGTHKHPAFEDEREFRILVYPIEQAEGRVFTGLADKKTIHHGPGGKKHVVLGNIWRPGVEPKRIIIGPKANPNIESVLKHFERRPLVTVCDIPIA
jgi:hypothetical protein